MPTVYTHDQNNTRISLPMFYVPQLFGLLAKLAQHCMKLELRDEEHSVMLGIYPIHW